MCHTLPTPRSAEEIARREWPPLRAAIIDVAAAMDRLELAGATDTRNEAEGLLALLMESAAPNRAETVLTRLSRGYDPSWRERFAAGETDADPPTERG